MQPSVLDTSVGDLASGRIKNVGGPLERFGFFPQRTGFVEQLLGARAEGSGLGSKPARFS